MGVAVRVIPCLDVDAGRVVKGVNFTGLRDAGDPVEMARVYDAEGADELTFLDITASSSGRETTYDVVRRTAEQVFIPLTVGGGVRSAADVDALLRAGADKVGINTAAVARPEFLAEASRRFGSQCARHRSGRVESAWIDCSSARIASSVLPSCWFATPRRKLASPRVLSVPRARARSPTALVSARPLVASVAYTISPIP